MASVLSLPLSVILLVHLHILEYPYASSSEYDHNLFNPTVRGIRDRAKSMEDICFFLVGKIEGSRDYAKKILPSYPCLQPTDSTGFRIALFRYLETLRHQALKGTPEDKDARSVSIPITLPSAWWWRDVVVRKSLLEDCSGDKFGRLILSVSTHALSKLSAREWDHIEEYNAASNLPMKYANLLATFKSKRNLWIDSASQLLRRQEDLRLLREDIAEGSKAEQSKYPSMSTDRILALTQSKRDDLLRFLWIGQCGQSALDFLIQWIGLQVSTSSSQCTHFKDYLNITPPEEQITVADVFPTPLPVAAAHHPSHLKKLRRSVFPTSTAKSAKGDASAGNPSPRTTSGLANQQLDAESRIKSALAEALARARRTNEGISARLAELKGVHNEGQISQNPQLDLWAGRQVIHRNNVNFQTRPTADLLASLSLSLPVQSLDARIDHIRQTLLPPYPPLTGPTTSISDHVDNTPQAQLVPASRIPRPPEGRATSDTYGELCQQPIAKSATGGKTTKFLGDQHPKPASNKKEGRPSKAPRKSIRKSLASTRAYLLLSDGMQCNSRTREVDNIVDNLQDLSISDDEDLPFSVLTPKGKPVPGTRLNTLTNNTQTIKKGPKSWVASPTSSPSMPALPELNSPGEDRSSTDGNPISAPRFVHRSSPLHYGTDEADDDDPEYEEELSINLRDILLQADTTQFDLLGGRLLIDQSMEWN